MIESNVIKTSLNNHKFSRKELDNEIHLWFKDLKQSEQEYRRYRKILNIEELKRLEQFFFEKDKRRFLVARGYMKEVIGKYLEIDPHDIVFTTTIYGKPQLIDSINQGVQFSLAHSHELAVLAITKSKVGVDIEYIHREINYQNIAKNFFSKSEYQIFTSLTEAQKKEGFYKCWTMKEAIRKVYGDEKILNLPDIEVLFTPGEKPRIIGIENDNDEAKKWILKSFTLLESYICAVVGLKNKCEHKLYYIKNDY
jgi:4'-phosphopantetheinyl transferase